MGSNSFCARFWGTRGDYPVPGRNTIHYGGNTVCVELQVDGYPLILDAGTGIVNLGYDLVRRARSEHGLKPTIATILLTHTHHDHTQGFPFFPPAYMGSSILHILGPHTFQVSLEEALSSVVMPPNFPLSLHEMASMKIVRSLHGNELLLIDREHGHLQLYDVLHDQIEPVSDKGISVRILRSPSHARHGVFVYRVEWRQRVVVFASDIEHPVGINQQLVDFARGADLLIHDAQYTQAQYRESKQGWGHSTPEMACELARLCGARQLVLFHHEPLHDDATIAQMEREAQAVFPNTLAAYEGLEIEL